MTIDVKPPRAPALDALRGLAILLMVLDHALMLCGVDIAPAGAGWIRCTVTRLAAAIFFGISGVLWGWRGPPDLRRVACCLAVGIGVSCSVTVVAWVLWVDVLLWFALFACFSQLVVQFPRTVIVLGVIQMMYLPLHLGFEPGYLLAFVGVGALGYVPGPVPRFPLLESIGRRPLTWYAGHWAALLLVSSIVQVFQHLMRSS